MSSSREQNISVFQRSATQPWEPPITAFTDTGGSLRNAPRFNSLKLEKNTYANKIVDQEPYQKYSNKEFATINKSPGAVISNSVSFSSVLNSVNRELSPVRWCDREVDGVYLGRSGWVQVQQRSLEDKKSVVYCENNTVSTLPLPKKFSSANEKKERDRPVNFPLSIKKRLNGERSEFIHGFKSASPPSITPIISPPPAFKDDGSDICQRGFEKKPFFWNESGLVASEGLKNSQPIRRNVMTISPSSNRPSYRTLHTKSLEDDYLRVQNRRLNSSTTLNSLGFRSLDNDRVPGSDSYHKNFEHLRETPDEKNEESDNEEISFTVKFHTEEPNGKRILSKPPRQRHSQRNGRRISPYEFCNGQRVRSSSEDSTSSASSSDSSYSGKSSDKMTSRKIKYKSKNQDFEKSYDKDNKHFFVKRSRSLQLSEKRSPSELIQMNHSSSGKSWDPMPPEGAQNHTRNQKPNWPSQFSHRLNHVLVTVNGESIPVMGSCDQSFRSLNSITTSEAEQKKLILEAEKEARIISEFLTKTRSRAAARNLLLHRYFNQSEDEGQKEAVEQNVPVGNAPDAQYWITDYGGSDSTYDGGGYYRKSQINTQQNPAYIQQPIAPAFRTAERLPNRSGSAMSIHSSDERRNRPNDKRNCERTCSLTWDQNNTRKLKVKNQNDSRSFDQEFSKLRIQKPGVFWNSKQKSNNKKDMSKLETNSVDLNYVPNLKQFRENAKVQSLDNIDIDDSSSVSSTSPTDLYPQYARTKLRKPGKLPHGSSYTQNGVGQDASLSRPGSAPENDENLTGGVDHRSLSLPRSFMSDRTSHQRDKSELKQNNHEFYNEVNDINLNVLQGFRTVPTTPIRDLRCEKSVESLNQVDTWSPSVFDEKQEFGPCKALFKDNTGSLERSPIDSKNRNGSLKSYKLNSRNPDGFFKNFKNSISSKYLKTKRSLKNGYESMSKDTEGESSEASIDYPLNRQHFENNNDICKRDFGQTLSDVNTGKKMFKNEKYDSHDSGIQLLNRGNVDSSESQDTDIQEDTDSPLAVRRREIRGVNNFHRPQSEVINQILIDKIKADLQWRSKIKRRNEGRGVRRTNSDLGGQRIFNWDVKNHCRTQAFYSTSLRGPYERYSYGSPSPEDSPRRIRLLKPRLRRSLSQPLGLNELPPYIRTTTPTSKSFALSEDEKKQRGKTSEDEFMSDSESSVISLSERKKSFGNAFREEAPILAEAVWDHVAMEACELPFRAGDVIEVLDTRDRDWWWGVTCENSGYFPSAFVRLRVSQEDTVEDCLAAMAKGKSSSTQLRRGKSVSLLSNDQVRSSVVRELLNTERDFVKILRDVKEGYVVQCRRRTDMFTPAQIATIFSNLEDLLAFQEKFLLDLETRVDQERPHKSCVGEAFLNHGASFRMYSEYCNSHPMAIATLQDLYQNSNYCKFFETCRLKQSLIEIPLDGYLLTPVQRICKYPLQLAELLKYTKPDHPDFRKVEEALETMRSVATLINERKRKMESLEKLAAWQQRVEGWEGEDLIEISSQLIHQGDVVRITSGMWTSNITLFLFDHQIIYCKKDLLKRNVYIYKGRIFLDDSVVLDLPDGKNQQLGVTIKYGLKITSSFTDKWLLFCCRSSEDKSKWLEALAEEKRVVAQDKEGGLDLPLAAKQLAKLAAKTKKSPPNKLRGKNKFASSQEEMVLRNGHSRGLKSKPGRRVGTWFTLGGVMKNSKGSFKPTASLQ